MMTLKHGSIIGLETSGIYTIVVDDGFVHNGTELPGHETLR